MIFHCYFVGGTALAKFPGEDENMENFPTQRDSESSHFQDGLVAAMMNPGFYPKPPPEITHKETHISHVFLTGDVVYKIKKAVRFSFLDYSTLSQRVHFLNEELRLNRRLAPSVYLAVIPHYGGCLGMAPWRGWPPRRVRFGHAAAARTAHAAVSSGNAPGHAGDDGRAGRGTSEIPYPCRANHFARSFPLSGGGGAEVEG